MKRARLRAPFSMLRELLGEPDEQHGMEKTSTYFGSVFEGRDVHVFDFHKEEWGNRPPCRTDSRYVWNVEAEDVEGFCRWLSAEVVKRMRSGAGGRSLDKADRARLDKLLAEGVSLNDALARVRMVSAEVADEYRWPVVDDDGAIPEPPAVRPPPSAPAPAPAVAKPVRRPVGTRSRAPAPVDDHRRRCAAIYLLVERATADAAQAVELRDAIGGLSEPGQRFLAAAADQPDLSEAGMRATISVTDEQFAEVEREIDRLLAESMADPVADPRTIGA